MIQFIDNAHMGFEMTTAQELADSMGVSLTDLMCLARGVAISIKQDRAADAFIAADEEQQTTLAEAYIPVAVKKFERFQLAVMTDSAKRSAVINAVAATA